MQKNRDKLPLLKPHIRRCVIAEVEISNHLQYEELERSNTQPLSSLANQSKNLPINHSLNTLGNNRSNNNKLFQSHESKGKKCSFHPIQDKSIQNFELIQYRKSIKHLINIFEERTNEMKQLNLNCYHSPLPSKRTKEIPNLNEFIVKEIETTKKHRSKLLQLKKKLRKSLLKTQGNESPTSKRKNHTDLKKVLNIHSPYSEQKASPYSFAKHNAILAFPQIQKFKEPFATPFKHQIQEIIERSKMTTLGGWNFDKNQTNYPL